MKYLSLALISASFLALSACSSSEETPPAAADASTDVKVETAPVETGTALVCAQDLETGYMCPTPVTAVGKTTCTEEMLQELAAKCITGTPDSLPAECATWKTTYPACAACVGDWSWSGISGAIYPDDYKCYWANMDAACAKSANCNYECQDLVCSECDKAEGSGTGTESEYGDCVTQASAAGGRCYDVAAKAADECFTKHAAAIAPCNIDELYAAAPDEATLRTQIVGLLRGACRDGGNWANSASGGDAGATDSGTDSGTSDTGAATDTGATDAAATDAGATDAGATDAGATSDATSSDAAEAG